MKRLLWLFAALPVMWVIQVDMRQIGAGRRERAQAEAIRPAVLGNEAGPKASPSVSPRPSGAGLLGAGLSGSGPTPTLTPMTRTPEPTRRPAAKPGAVPATAGGAAVNPDLAPESVCPGQSDKAKAAAALVCMTTWARTHHGLNAVGAQAGLMAAAEAKAGDLAACGFSHTACGRAADYWLGAKGYGQACSAENIAYGQTTPGAVFAGWMGSAGHRANILRPGYVDAGAAVTSGSAVMWVMELGGC